MIVVVVGRKGRVEKGRKGKWGEGGLLGTRARHLEHELSTEFGADKLLQ